MAFHFVVVKKILGGISHLGSINLTHLNHVSDHKMGKLLKFCPVLVQDLYKN